MRGIASYRKNRVQAASQSQLLLMLMRKAVLELDEAAEAHGEQDWKAWQVHLHHVRAIYGELLFGLDDKAAPDLVSNLRGLYGWCIRELSAAERDRELTHVVGVRKVSETMLSAWTETLDGEVG